MSIEAVNLRTGATFRYGAGSGMRTGSIAKLYILETLLLQHQRAGTPLTASQRQLATRMIENSDNEAADALFQAVGFGAGLTHAAGALSVQHTVPGPGYRWGWTQTSAADYVALLRDLTGPGPLTPASRAYVLGLMGQVEIDQRWGVSAAADAGTVVRLKNGWLGTSLDGGRWLTNSVGIVTVHGQTVLLAVLTQHNRDFAAGRALVQQLARISAPVVAPAASR